MGDNNFNDDVKEKILRDIRETDNKYSKKIIIKEGWDDLETRHSIYVKRNFKPDAERWYGAIESYKCYPEFNNLKTCKDRSGFPILAYEMENNKRIFLAADLLTNPSPIIEKYNKVFKDEERELLHAFLKVSYTAGNFCPVWYNLANGRGNRNDTIWYKLDRHILKVEKFVGVKEQDEEKYENLRKRQANCQIFDVLLDGPNDKSKVIKALLFQDFFREDNTLLQETVIPDEKEMLANYINMTTRCIVTRGYRIFAKDKPYNPLDENDKKNIEDLLREIRLPNFC